MVVLAHGDDVGGVAPISLARLFTAWSFEPLPLLAIAVIAGLYLAGLQRMRKRGDAWSVWRSVAFLGAGCGSLLIATCSSLGTYDDTLISMHMAQHMLLSMVAPVFLALGAPVTLALRTLPGRARSVVLAVLHSRAAKVLTFPVVTFALFVLSPWVLYFSGWYDATLHNDALHDLLHLHFIVVGCLFFWPLVGLDPVPGRVPYPFRMLTMFATLPFHAFLGVTVMSMDALIAGDWYRGLGRDWPPTLIQDQHIAGGILWGSGDLVGLVIFSVLFVQWVRESHREARREDRRLDREEALRRGAAGADDPPPAPREPAESR